MKEIQLTQGYLALVDDEDFERVNQFKWCAQKIGNTVYAARSIHINGIRIYHYLHFYILSSNKIDHINRNGIDCQKHNLRPCTHQQNMMNVGPNKNTKSKYKGVYWYKTGKKWESFITFNKKSYYLGRFKFEIDAAKAYDKKAKELFKEFAYLNFK